MQVPFVDLPREIRPFHDEIRQVLDDVIFRRADFIMRDDLLEFEKRFAAYVGVRHAIGVANGSDALNLAVKVLGIGPGDEVITVSHTFVATIAAVVHAGATPVLVDVGDDHVIDVDAVRKAVTRKTRAIIPVHLNGQVCDMDALGSIAREHRLFIIEDSAQAIGATYKGRKAGSLGILSTNSFYPFKILGGFGDGGAITTSDPDLDYKLRCLRDNGQDRAKGEILFWGWNSRLDNLQAAILTVLLRHIDEMITRRRQVAQMYFDGLHGVGDLILPVPPTREGFVFNSYQNYVIRTGRRDQLVDHLRQSGVGVLISWPVPTHAHRGLGLAQFHLPMTERLSREVISLPMHHAVSDDEAAQVISTIRRFF